MMNNRFVEKLRAYGRFSAEEVELLEKSTRGGSSYRRRHDLIRERDTPGVVFVVINGWACGYYVLPEGTRQMISLLMPGDFFDMHVAALTEMYHRICARSRTRRS